MARCSMICVDHGAIAVIIEVGLTVCVCRSAGVLLNR